MLADPNFSEYFETKTKTAGDRYYVIHDVLSAISEDPHVIADDDDLGLDDDDDEVSGSSSSSSSAAAAAAAATASTAARGGNAPSSSSSTGLFGLGANFLTGADKTKKPRKKAARGKEETEQEKMERQMFEAALNIATPSNAASKRPRATPGGSPQPKGKMQRGELLEE